MNITKAYLLELDCEHLPDGDPTSVLTLHGMMAPDGRLDCRSLSAAAADLAPVRLGYRVVRPRLFLGRDGEGRLGFLCDVLGTGAAAPELLDAAG